MLIKIPKSVDLTSTDDDQGYLGVETCLLPRAGSRRSSRNFFFSVHRWEKPEPQREGRSYALVRIKREAGSCMNQSES